MRCVHFNVCCQCLPVDHKLHSPESRSGKCKCQKEKGMKPLHCFVNIINKVNFLNEKEWFCACQLVLILRNVAHVVTSEGKSRVESTGLQPPE